MILEYIRNNISSSDFGGLYVDQSKKGVVTISFSKNLKQMNKEINDIRKIFDNDSKIKFKQVQRSEKQLDEIHSTVLSKKHELKEQGINVTTIYSDIQRNKVIIGIYPFDSTARDSLVNIFGSDIEVIESDGGYEESRTAYGSQIRGVHEGVGSNGWKMYTHVQSIVDYWGLSPRTW